MYHRFLPVTLIASEAIGSFLKMDFGNSYASVTSRSRYTVASKTLYSLAVLKASVAPLLASGEKNTSLVVINVWLGTSLPPANIGLPVFGSPYTPGNIQTFWRSLVSSVTPLPSSELIVSEDISPPTVISNNALNEKPLNVIVLVMPNLKSGFGLPI